MDETEGKVVSIRLALEEEEEEEERALPSLPEEARSTPRKHTRLYRSATALSSSVLMCPQERELA